MEPKYKIGDTVVYTGGFLADFQTALRIGWVIEGENWVLYQLIDADGVSIGYTDECLLEPAE